MGVSTEKILEGTITFSNGFPISLLVGKPVPFLKIRDLQARYSEALGYPVVVIEGHLSGIA